MCKIMTPVAGHKYYIYAEIANVDAGASYVGIMHGNGTADGKIPADGYDGTDWIKASGIITASEEATTIGMRIPNAAQTGQSAKFYGVIVRDLTKMFGAGNEPTASELEVMYNVKDSGTPDTGSLLSFNGTGIKTVGFNLFDADTVMASKGFAKQADGSWYGTPVSFDVWENTVGYTGQVDLSFTIKHDSASGVGQSFCFKYTDGTRSTYYPTSSQGSTEWVSYSRKSDASKVVASVTATRQTSSNKAWIRDICVNFAWSGYRDGEYEDYWTRTLALPVSTYFPDGMRSVGTTFDELTADKAVKRIGSRTYAEGDEDDPTVLTDGTETLYALASPVETAIETPLNLTYQVDDFGTEQLLPANSGAAPTTAQFTGVIAYSTDFPRQINGLPKNYTSQATLDDLLTALCTALHLTYTKTWNAAGSKWTFVFTEVTE